jgi:tRNA-modifying protein YgfZ
MTTTLEGAAPLPHLGVIRVDGEDAASFLQGQLTQDFALVGAGEARLAAFCNAKGRMQASFVGVPLGSGTFALVVAQDLLERTLRRLSMFVLRAKARLSDATGEFQLLGLAGSTVRQAAGGSLPAPWEHVSHNGIHVVGLYPADGHARALWLAPAGTEPPDAPALDADLWRWSEVRSGVATVTAPVFEAFVPQMLNYESVGGVNFRKGCYPGQEVVARSQFRGTLKRRAFPARCAQPLAAGTELFHESDPDQPCGLVAQAARAPDGEWDAIVSIQLSATEGSRIGVGAAQGPELRLQALPYPLLADI